MRENLSFKTHVVSSVFGEKRPRFALNSVGTFLLFRAVPKKQKGSDTVWSKTRALFTKNARNHVHFEAEVFAHPQAVFSAKTVT